MLHVSSVPFLTFNRKEWSSLREEIPLILSPKEILNLRRINDNLSMNEVIEIYLPLSRLLNLYICSHIKRQNILEQFLSIQNQHIPYIIGIVGGVAVGKSTTARVLQALLSRWPEHRVVELVTTDGFLHSNKVLKKRRLMKKKGFPQSYDMTNLVNFVSKVKSGVQSMTIPVYSHVIYDIIPNVQQVIYKPDILILEGLNVLQTNHNYHYNLPCVFVSDFVDFSIYVDAPEYLLQEWYIDRFLKFCYTTFSYPDSYFYRYTQLSKKNVISIASQIWTKINRLNLQENILPTRERANLILRKDVNHIINNVQLRK
ncbi:type I pantothenate kinase [Blochmannia endosymbiont of Camponotus sp.]|uniref:type I pantothenate kinase n=1 Tax=Blochmannia endosymbiont of Camponotus sp. TaxID=700220 RepID=UPI002024DFFB|nr:type I pantothenate kinase [Blochmannia endosymbiont of Camponotus sp.]URJ25703.1 type I pantothenate kinase [Blochmannia endosymbiont of Camponotus sp.]